MKTLILLAMLTTSALAQSRNKKLEYGNAIGTDTRYRVSRMAPADYRSNPEWQRLNSIAMQQQQLLAGYHNKILSLQKQGKDEEVKKLQGIMATVRSNQLATFAAMDKLEPKKK